MPRETSSSTGEPGPTPMRRSDPRAQRSRAALRDALLRLIEDRSLDKITLREVTAEAGVSYPTFFNHYRDRDALFQDLAREEVLGLLAAFRAGRTAPDWRPGEGVCAYIVERRDLWRTLLTTGASEAMRSEFIRHGRAIAGERTDLGHGAPIDVVSGVIAGGIFEIAAWWLAHDGEATPAQVAHMLEALVIEPALNLPRGHFTGRREP